MKAVLPCAVILLGLTVSALARDCSVSREFQLKRPQLLAGVLEDPSGATLPGIELELLSGKKVVQHLRTNNQGAYDFGEVAAGKYRIHVQHGGGVFCAPKVRCETEGCSLKPRLTVNQKNVVTVY